MRKAMVLVAALLMCMSLGMATVHTNVHGYSTGFYDYSQSVGLTGNAGGSALYGFAPDGFTSSGIWTGYNCGNKQDFTITTDQTLSFNKQPGTPQDPYFHDWSVVMGAGKGKDTATVTTGAGMTIVSGWASGGISTSIEAKADSVEYGIYATDYAGWASSMGFWASDYKPKTLSLQGGAKFDPTVSLYPSAGMNWDIS